MRKNSQLIKISHYMGYLKQVQVSTFASNALVYIWLYRHVLLISLQRRAAPAVGRVLGCSFLGSRALCRIPSMEVGG